MLTVVVWYNRRRTGDGQRSDELWAGGAGRVRGTPFSAQEITEKSLLLPNGSISKQSIIALITRDAEGRTRREVVPSVMPGQPPQPGLTMISDPVAGYLYLPHPNMTALRSLLPAGGQAPALPKPPTPPDLRRRKLRRLIDHASKDLRGRAAARQ